MSILEQDKIVDDKLDLAGLYFKSAEYNKALHQYNEVIRRVSKLPVESITHIRSNKYNLGKPLLGSTIHPKLGSALDQRAATYQKLNQYHRALSDGEQINKLEPLSCKGYLRVGKLLQLMEKELEAYKIYQRGIYTIEKAVKEFKVNVPERLFQQLKSQYLILNKKLKKQERPKLTMQIVEKSSLEVRLEKMIPLKRQLSISQKLQESYKRLPGLSYEAPLELLDNEVNTPTRSVILDKRTKLHSNALRRSTDPLRSLPLEIIQIIFKNYPLKFVLKCFAVCKHWHETLLDIPSLYNHVHFRRSVSKQEFVNGVKLIKTITHKTFSKQINSLKLNSALNLVQLKRIVEIIISEPNFSMKSLDLVDRAFNFQLFLQCLSKFNWRLNNLQNIHTLRWGINSSLRYEQILFKLFKNLKVLNIIILLPELSSSFREYLPLDKRFRQLMKIEDEEPYESLKTLVVVNHPKLIKNEIRLSISSDTFNPYPLFLNKIFPNLTELSIVSFDFTNLLPKLGDFLMNTPLMSRLLFENNENFTIWEFLQLLKNYNPEFRLSKLTFREKLASSALSMNAFSLTDLEQLSYILLLDINGCSLTNNGILKLLQITNRNGNLTHLSLGGSNYLKFKTDVFGSGRTNLLWLFDILRIVPGVTNLYMQELELDNHTMKTFHNDIKKFGFENCKLKVLDISFCKVTGIGLVELFCAVPSNIQRIKGQELFADAFRLEELGIDGMEINQATLSMLTKHEFVKVIRGDVNKKRWRQFGVNSLVVQ